MVMRIYNTVCCCFGVYITGAWLRLDIIVVHTQSSAETV